MADLEIVETDQGPHVVVGPDDYEALDQLAASATLPQGQCRIPERGRLFVELRPGMLHDPVKLEPILLRHPHLAFAAHRLEHEGWLPPCTMPDAWLARPDAWRATFDTRAPARALPICGDCAFADRCRFGDSAALSPETLAAARPLRPRLLPWERRAPRVLAAPIVPDVICTTPWTTMEVVDLDGVVHQCCAEWTAGHRGALREAPLAAIWNGDGYRAARRTMASGEIGSLCLPICPRPRDRQWSGARFTIQDGSPAFVENQRAIAADIAARREEATGLPLHLAICPSTYCNYDCIMCLHGRTPRRDLPGAIWDELPRFLPTLRTLTLLGGEPFALPRVIDLLAGFDPDRWPDVAVDVTTNGSLLTDKLLPRFARTTFGDITVSLNAGTPDVYERVQRGLSLKAVLANVDALLAFRATHRRPFGITLSFVVQPANAHTLIHFGELARERDLRIRLLPLNPRGPDGLDYYDDPEAVARVLHHLDAFTRHAERVRPAWCDHIRAIRGAIAAQASQGSPTTI